MAKINLSRMDVQALMDLREEVEEHSFHNVPPSKGSCRRLEVPSHRSVGQLRAAGAEAL
jgi:hypothetical protein